MLESVSAILVSRELKMRERAHSVVSGSIYHKHTHHKQTQFATNKSSHFLHKHTRFSTHCDTPTPLALCPYTDCYMECKECFQSGGDLDNVAGDRAAGKCAGSQTALLVPVSPTQPLVQWNVILALPSPQARSSCHVQPPNPLPPNTVLMELSPRLVYTAPLPPPSLACSHPVLAALHVCVLLQYKLSRYSC